jgi:hypothetical protein
MCIGAGVGIIVTITAGGGMAAATALGGIGKTSSVR